VTAPVVGIDCSPLLVRSAGVKTYLYHWLKEVQRQSPETIRPFLAPPHLDRLEHMKGGPLTYPARIAVLLALNRLPRAFCDAAIPRCDIFHVSNLLRTVPIRPRLTATLHDLTTWILPECHKPSLVAAEKIFAKRTLGQAAGVIAVSESTKRDAIRLLGLAAEKIQVIHPGIARDYFSVDCESIDRVARAYNLRRPWFLFTGTIEPRKNVDTLLSAWEALPESFRGAHELLIAGGHGWRADATMNRLHEANRKSEGTRYLGYVPEADLPGLTAGARAFIYPSLYEGFGIPVAQAMAAGCPVITSNVSSLPEITAGAAVLIDPLSAGELAAAILRISDSEHTRTRLINDGLERAGLYTWEAAAAKSLEFFASRA